MQPRPARNPLPMLGATAVEYDPDCEAPANVTVIEDHSRSILSRNDSPDLPFRWSANPYRGCVHACAYCYARPTHEYLDLGTGSDFDTKIVVKPEAANLLREAFDKPSWTGACFKSCHQMPLATASQMPGALGNNQVAER